MADYKEIFEAFVNAYWLRPETALWRSLDVLAMQPFAFESPSVDLGCGDGVFSFIRAGGRFGPEFDVFQSTKNMSLTKYFDGEDVYDHFSDICNMVLVSKPKYNIDYGLDLKEALLRKADGLGLYRNLIQCDANQGLPFEDASISTVFSNIVYWLDDPAHIFSELSRVLKIGGRACILLPNATFGEYTFFNNLAEIDGNVLSFLEPLNRGRVGDNIKHAKTHEEWVCLFRGAGLEPIYHKAHLSRTVVRIWDVGMRPLFPVLKRMANAIDKDELLVIKKEWVEIFNRFIMPFTRVDNMIDVDVEPGFHCYICQKSEDA